MRQLSHVAPVKAVVRVAIVVGALATLTGCISIPKRAWANGAAMSESRAYQEVMAGNTSFAVRRQLQQTLDARRLNYTEVRYPAFGTWW